MNIYLFSVFINFLYSCRMVSRNKETPIDIHVTTLIFGACLLGPLTLVILGTYEWIKLLWKFFGFIQGPIPEKYDGIVGRD